MTLPFIELMQQNYCAILESEYQSEKLSRERFIIERKFHNAKHQNKNGKIHHIDVPKTIVITEPLMSRIYVRYRDQTL